MVRIFGQNGFVVHIWPNDHEPAHVHVYRAEGLAKIEIRSLGLRVAYDMKPKDVRRAIDIVAANQIPFLRKWREIHGG
ncbi:MAG TPA: DUF4160 domain-containing protein [Longimicrobium sp.]